MADRTEAAASTSGRGSTDYGPDSYWRLDAPLDNLSSYSLEAVEDFFRPVDYSTVTDGLTNDVLGVANDIVGVADDADAVPCHVLQIAEGGSKIIRVISKRLTASDSSRNYLTIPQGQACGCLV